MQHEKLWHLIKKLKHYISETTLHIDRGNKTEMEGFKAWQITWFVMAVSFGV